MTSHLNPNPKTQNAEPSTLQPQTVGGRGRAGRLLGERCLTPSALNPHSVLSNPQACAAAGLWLSLQGVQGFAERLLAVLRKSTDKFEVAPLPYLPLSRCLPIRALTLC